MKKVMMGTSELNLMAFINNSEKVVNQVNEESVIDAKLYVVTPTGEKVEIGVMEFLKIQWNGFCPETEEAYEIELGIHYK